MLYSTLILMELIFIYQSELFRSQAFNYFLGPIPMVHVNIDYRDFPYKIKDKILTQLSFWSYISNMLLQLRHY